ncbi:hypothetical protein D770_05295 [Flammeovirgaceae bacterium 311]|nr:hypothetical protein D770_05295 [Flammeovirgaceae bacterium 311]
MGTIIKNKRHYYTRFPIWLALILLFGLSPMIIGFFGAWVTELITGESCHEGNCTWMVLPWFTIITLPVGGGILLVYLVIIVIDTIRLLKKGNDRHANNRIKQMPQLLSVIDNASSNFCVLSAMVGEGRLLYSMDVTCKK